MQDVIRRHFYHKKEAIIEQVQTWLRQVQTDYANATNKDKNDKKNLSDMNGGLGVVSVKSMEKSVELLFAELAQLNDSSCTTE